MKTIRLYFFFFFVFGTVLFSLHKGWHVAIEKLAKFKYGCLSRVGVTILSIIISLLVSVESYGADTLENVNETTVAIPIDVQLSVENVRRFDQWVQHYVNKDCKFGVNCCCCQNTEQTPTMCQKIGCRTQQALYGCLLFCVVGLATGNTLGMAMTGGYW